ncbi:MAG: response regulator [SAR324 cluster bacterium]|nr:response regulator [SAR324 cluster bacterium]
MADILIVDDSRGIRTEVQGFLSKQGYKVITANDGNEGIQKIQSHPELKLVISDVNMPELDGISMVEKIRLEMENQQIQILMFTTENHPALKKRAKDLKVNGWLVKPFIGEKILPVVKKLIG